MIQNAAARLVFNEPKRAHATPLFNSLHWLPVAARIKFKTLMLAYRITTDSAPAYFHSLLWFYILPEAPPTSTHYYESTSPPEAPPTSTHYYDSTSFQKPRLLPLTIMILYPSRSPAYFHSLLRFYILPEAPPTSTHSPPHPERWIPVNLQVTTENSSFSTLLDFILKKKKSLSLSFFSLSSSPSLASLYLLEQCLRLGVTSTFSVCLPLQD